MTTRKIIHIDMDAFYASVEQRDFPELRGKPVIVGGEPNSRGVVATASYEARRFGIHSAMPSAQAYQLCPQAIFVHPRFQVYRTVSAEIHAIFQHYTELIEPLSLDEAYLDVTASDRHRGSATLIAEDIRAEIKKRLRLNASAGVSYNKMLAKIASDLNKPNGIAIITPADALDFIANLKIEKFHGIGQATTLHMHQLGIYTGADLRNMDETTLIAHFGKRGAFYYSIARGIDERPVEARRVRKSVGSETTFAVNLNRDEDILDALFAQNLEAWQALVKRHLQARTLTIKLKFADFSQLTRSISDVDEILTLEAAQTLIKHLYAKLARTQSVRLVGVTFSNLSPQHAPKQRRLFD